MIKVGDKLPAGNLQEFVEVEGNGCSIGPNTFDVDKATAGKVRMMADGSADFAKATGLTFDLTSRGMGIRSQRYSMLVQDGVVQALNIEAPGKFEVSDARTLLEQARRLKR